MKQTINLFQNNDNYNLFRKERYDARTFLQLFTSHKNISICGHYSFNKRVDFFRGINSDGLFRASYRNVISCRSTWCCPVCSYKIASVRGFQINKIFSTFQKNNYHLLFSTFTIHHNSNSSLSDLWNRLLLSYEKFQAGKSYSLLLKKYNIIGSIRVVELTHSHKNSWHIHIHTVYISSTKNNIKNFTNDFYNRWDSVTSRFGVKTSIKGFKIVRSFSDSGLASYINKNTYKLSDELTKGYNKKYSKSRTPFSILENMKKNNQFFCTCVDFVTGEVIKKLTCDFCLWSEFETVSRGRRQIGYSGKKHIKKLLDELELDIDKVEDDLIIFNNEYIFSITAPDYRTLVSRNLLIPVLDAMQSNIDDAKLILVQNNILYYTIKNIKEMENEKELNRNN